MIKKTYSILILISIVLAAACIYVVSDAQKKAELAGKISGQLTIPVVQDQKITSSPVPKMNPTIVASSTNGYKLVQYSIQDSPFYKSASNCIQTDSGFKSSAKYFQHLLDSETDMRLEYQGNIVIPSLRQFTLRENDHDCFGAETVVFSWPINGDNIYFYSYYDFENDKLNPGFVGLFKINLSNYSVHKLLSTNIITRSISPEDGYLYVYTPDTYTILSDGERVIKWTTTSIYLVDLNKDLVSTLYTVPAQAWLVKKLYAAQDTLAKFDVKINGSRIDFGIYSKNLTASDTLVTTDQYGNYNVVWKNGIADMKFISQGSVLIPSY